MKYLKYAMALCLCLIIFAPAVAANKEEESGGWEKAVLLSERDTRRLNLYLSDEVEQDVQQALEDENCGNAQVDYSGAYIRYEVDDYMLASLYDYETDSVIHEYINYDGLPGSPGRIIAVPVYLDGQLAGELHFNDYAPEEESYEPPTTPPYRYEFMYFSPHYGFVQFRYNDREWDYAQQGYDLLTSMGEQVQAIYFTQDNYNLFRTEGGYYLYPVQIRGEAHKGSQAVKLDDYIIMWSYRQIGPAPTPTPEPTPVPILPYTPKYTPRPSPTSRKTQTAPRSSVSFSSAASPTDPTILMPETHSWTAGRITALVLAGIAVLCATGGGIIWAVSASRIKKKE